LERLTVTLEARDERSVLLGRRVAEVEQRVQGDADKQDGGEAGHTEDAGDD
jgi:hypothetical protein